MLAVLDFDLSTLNFVVQPAINFTGKRLRSSDRKYEVPSKIPKSKTKPFWILTLVH